MKLLALILASQFFVTFPVSAAPTESQTGVAQVIVTNNCPFPIWAKPDSQGFDAPIVDIPSRSGLALDLSSEPGNAYKLADNQDVENPIQFDYSIEYNRVWYDVSDAAGHPFDLKAYDIGPDGTSSCRIVGCGATGPRCKAVASCAADHSFHVVACP